MLLDVYPSTLVLRIADRGCSFCHAKLLVFENVLRDQFSLQLIWINAPFILSLKTENQNLLKVQPDGAKKV